MKFFHDVRPSRRRHALDRARFAIDATRRRRDDATRTTRVERDRCRRSAQGASRTTRRAATSPASALYVEDLPRLERELWVDFVAQPVRQRAPASRSTPPRRGAIPGVVGVYTHADIPGHNAFGPIFADEPFLPSDRVELRRPAGRRDRRRDRSARARAARRRGRLEIDERAAGPLDRGGRRRGLYLGVERRIARGDLDAALRRGARTWSKACSRAAGRSSSTSRARRRSPGRARTGELTVHSSTQHPSEVQVVVAEVLGVAASTRWCASCRRMGGGFGGKETQAAHPALMAALVARTHRAAGARRLRQGRRHALDRQAPPVRSRVPGRLRPRRRASRGAELELLLQRRRARRPLARRARAGACCTPTTPYFLPNVGIRGARLPHQPAAATPRSAASAGRRAMAVIENVMEEIAARLGRDALDVRRAQSLRRLDDATQRRRRYGQVRRATTRCRELLRPSSIASAAPTTASA